MEAQKLLEEFGFTQYETKVYLALASLGTAKASVVAVKSRVPQNKVYESLIRLAEKGFVTSLDVSPRQFKVAGIQQFKEILEHRETQTKKLKAALTKFENSLLRQQFDVAQSATVLKGKNKVIQLLCEKTATVQHFNYSFGGSLRFNYRSARIVKEAIKRGVDVRFIIHYDPLREKVYTQWRSVGAKIRFYPKNEQKSVRFSVFDGKVCRVTVGAPEISRSEDYLTFSVESSAFSLLLKERFLEMWDEASDAAPKITSQKKLPKPF